MAKILFSEIEVRERRAEDLKIREAIERRLILETIQMASTEDLKILFPIIKTGTCGGVATLQVKIIIPDNDPCPIAEEAIKRHLQDDMVDLIFKRRGILGDQMGEELRDKQNPFK